MTFAKYMGIVVPFSFTCNSQGTEVNLVMTVAGQRHEMTVSPEVARKASIEMRVSADVADENRVNG